MQSSAVYFEVTIDGSAIVGPVTVEQLRHGLAAGRLPQNAWVRTPGTAQWLPLANVIGYAPPAAPDPQLAHAQRELHETQARLTSLRRELESAEEAIEIQSFGVYRPKYGFQTSDQYEQRLEHVRNHGLVTFVITPEAEQWRKTRALLGSATQLSETDVLEVSYEGR